MDGADAVAQRDARETTIDKLFEEARSGQQRAIARLCSIIERGASEDLLSSLDVVGRHWKADVITITGAPGAGKSTLVARLIAHYRRDGRRVAVLAVDPSSSITGGALLGDRVRLDPKDLDDGVFFRSVADHGHRGGITAATGADIALFDTCGFDVVLVETVGTGQSDVDVRSFVDTVVVVCAPGSGDEIQALKAGILEIGDVFVVSKSDLDGAAQVERDLREMVMLGSYPEGSWRPPVLKVSAADDASIEALRQELSGRRAWLEAHVSHLERARSRARAQIVDAALNLVRTRLAQGSGAEAAQRLGDQVAAGKVDVQIAAQKVLTELLAADNSDGASPAL